MNVLHLISSGGFFGAEGVLLNLAEGLKKQGITPLVVGIRNTHNPHLEIVTEAEKRGLSTAVIESRGRWDLRAVFSLANLVRERNIDIIHSHNYKANLVAALASQKVKIPLVVTNHAWTGENLKLRFYEMLDGLILSCYARKVIAVAGTIKRDMMRYGVSGSKIEVIFNGIDPDKQVKNDGNLRDAFSIPSSALVIGVVARLSPEKGHSFLFKAAQSLIGEFPNLVFFIVGEGPLKESLKSSLDWFDYAHHMSARDSRWSQVASSKLKDKVIFAGYRKDMTAVYNTIDILVQPSLGEGLPMVLLEAMSLGKPIIATDVGATAELIRNNETGLLIPRRSVSHLAGAIRIFLKDVSLRTRCGENARRVVRADFSLEKMLNSYKKVYEEIVKCS